MSRKNNKTNKLSLNLRHVEPLNDKQAKVLYSDSNLALDGCAGTGKTFLASALAYQGLASNEFDRVIFIRSAVSTRDIGFLPGSEKEKMAVYKLPYIDITAELYGRGDAFHILENHGVVHFEPTSFIRGRTLRDAFVIVDEAQNMSFHELDSLITRLDNNSRIVFCGDRVAQNDLPNNGFKDFHKVLNTMKQFETVTFGLEDIVRGELVKSYLEAKYALFDKGRLS